MQNVQGDESKGYPAPRSLFPCHQDLIVKNELCKQDNHSSDIEFESTMAGIVENYANTSIASPIRKDEVLVRDLVMQDPESRDHNVGTALQVAPLISKPEIPCQEPELSLQISADRHTKSEGIYFFGTSFLCLLLSVCFDHLHYRYYHFTTFSKFLMSCEI